MNHDERFEVVVGNAGTVYRGKSTEEAVVTYNTYVRLAKEGYGRVAYEPVYLFEDGELVAEDYCEWEEEDSAPTTYSP